MDYRKMVLKETGFLALGEAICVAVMYGAFAVTGYFDKSVLLGGLVGAVLAILNFFFLAVNVSQAMDKAVDQDVKGGKALVQSSYVFRLAAIFVVLFVCVKSGMCNVFAAVIPLFLVRVILTITEFFRKPGE